ncbi:MAG: penicillin-binding protein [Blastocatellia bacterium]|nr:penicillin-binding protein [Blastocatellia bacterium]
MKQTARFFAPILMLFVTVTLLPLNSAYAGKKRGSRSSKQSSKQSARKQVAKVSRNSKKQVAKVEKSSRSGKKGKVVPSGPSLQELAKRERRGKLSKAEKRQLASARAEARRREAARLAAIRAARERAIRAHESALKNLAANNIQNDDTNGEDPIVRQAAIEALGGKAGTVVVMDATNGRIYSIVNQKMALASPVKPCSTVKPIVSLAALQENVFDPNTEVSFRGGSMTLTDAVARSNNPFFQELGRRLGYDRVVRYAQQFGFGQTTGINLPGEDTGFVPEEFSTLMSSHGDGFGVTAMQLSIFTAAIANGGNLYVPRVPKTQQEAANFKPQLRRKIEMTPENRLRMLAGMAGTVNYGTGKAAFDPVGQVAGKTGTCTDRDKLGLFTSFNSVDNPKLVVTVITTGRGEAGKKAADIAGRVYRSISYRFLRDGATLTATSAGTEAKSKPDNVSSSQDQE